MKNVQIPADLFFDICRYHLLADPAAPDCEELTQSIAAGLQTKLGALQRHAAYSAFKDQSASPEDREAARQQYLDLVGMLPGYRWPQELTPNTFP